MAIAAALPMILSAGSAVMGGISSISQGNAQASQYADQAAIAQRQAQDIDLQSTQMSSQARANLQAGESTIAARRAAAGLGLDSPTAQAIESNYAKLSRNNENIQAVGYGNQAYALQAKAAMDQQAEGPAELQGYLGAAQKFSSGFMSMSGSGAFGGGGGGGDQLAGLY